MSNKWRERVGNNGAYWEIDRDELTKILFAHFEAQIDEEARRAAENARSFLPDAEMKERVGVKTVKETPSQWQVEWNGGRKKREGISLMKGLRIPVALVTVDTAYAVEWEYGAILAEGKKPNRWQKQYKPLTNALKMARGRFILKERESTSRRPKRKRK